MSTESVTFCIVGGEVSVHVARIHFLSVSLANVSLFLINLYNIDSIYYCKLYLKSI